VQDNKKFRVMLFSLGEKYEKEISSHFTDMVWEVLEPYSDQLCIQAFGHVFRYGRFWKDVVPDLIEFLELEEKIIETSAPEIEADRVIAHLNAHGGSAPLPADDPITEYLMTSRWPYQTWAAGVLTKDIVWWRKDFIEAYKNRKRTGVPRLIEASPEVRRLVRDIVAGQAED